MASLVLIVTAKDMTLTILKPKLPGSGKTAAFLVPMLSRIYEEGPFENAVRNWHFFVYVVIEFSFYTISWSIIFCLNYDRKTIVFLK